MVAHKKYVCDLKDGNNWSVRKYLFNAYINSTEIVTPFRMLRITCIKILMRKARFTPNYDVFRFFVFFLRLLHDHRRVYVYIWMWIITVDWKRSHLRSSKYCLVQFVDRDESSFEIIYMYSLIISTLFVLNSMERNTFRL